MERRTFIGVMAGSLFAAPLAAEAQRTRPLRVGYLGVVPRPPDEAFKQGLRELGYVEGRNIIIEYRWGEGDGEAAVRFAREFVDLDVDVIVAVASRAARAAKQATSRVPIVMVDIADPIAFGFVTNLARPEGNITGFSAAANELSAKSLQLLKELVPGLRRVVVLRPGIPGTAVGIRPAEAAAAAMGLRLERQEVPRSSDFSTAFAAIVQSRADAMMVVADHFLYSHHPRIIEFAAKNRLPTVYGLREYVPAGGLMALGANRVEMFHRAAFYVDKILKGAKPADLPVEQPTKFELVINIKTAKALGLTIPPSLLLQADEVIACPEKADASSGC